MSDSDIGGDLPPLDPELAAWLAADAPGPMPADVWAGIQARLSEEAPLVPAGVVDLDSERERRRPRRVLPWLVGAAGVMVVGAVVVPSLQTSSPAPVADGASTAQPAVAAAPATEAGGVVASAPAASPSGSDAGDASGSVTAIPRSIIATGTDYSGESLPEQVTSLLSTSGMVDQAAVTAALTASPAATTMPGVGLSSSPEALADCLGRLGLPPDAMPLVLDRGTVNGRDGSLIVTIGAQDSAGIPTALHAVAVGQDCSEEDVAAAQHLDIPLR